MANTTFWRRTSLRRPLLAIGLVLVAVTVISGCADEKTRNTIDQRTEETQKGLDKIGQIDAAKHYNPLVVTDKVWTGNTALRMHRGVPLPEKYETAHGVTLVSADPMSLADIAEAISGQTGIPVHLADAPAAKGGPTTMPVAYEGPLSGLMERVSGNFGINWHYDGSTISINRFETRVFVIEALPGTQNVQEGMQDNSGGSGGSSAGGGQNATSQNTITQNSKFTIDIKYWDELGQILTAMLGGTGSVVVSPSIGTVTVSTTPEIMRNVSDYLAQENQRFSRQIAVNIEIYTVSLSNQTDFNIAFTTALKRLKNFGANITTGVGAPASPGFTSFSGDGSLSVAILNPNTVGSVSDIFTALSAVGDTTKVAKFPLVTLNNRPVSRRVGEDIVYAASTTISPATTTTGATSSITPGIIPQGFTVQLTPRLLDDGRILLEYSLNIIDVLSIDTFNSVCGPSSGSTTSSSSTSSCTSSTAAAGSSSIQVPKTANRIFVQQSVLKSGSTLFIGGAEEEDATQNSQGVGDAFNYLLGGGNSSGISRTLVFFAITPQVLDVPHSEQD